MSTIISKRKKFVFIHIAKAAGTSVTRVLEPYADPRILSSKVVRNAVHIAGHWLGVDFMRYTGRYILPLHATASMLQERYPECDFGGFFRFTVVRNPWDRLLSMYIFHKAARKKFTDPKRFRENNSVGFAEYVEALCSEAPRNQVDCLFRDINGNLNMDYIAKVENLEADMAIILNRLGLPGKRIPRQNTTQHEHYTSYYDTHSRSLTGKAFSRDIEALDYKFGV